MVKLCIGEVSSGLIETLEEELSKQYDLNSKMRFWDSWQKGYWHKKAWLFDTIFKEDGITITLTITDKKVSEMEDVQHNLQLRLQELWKNRKKFGPSSWPMTFDLESEEDVVDLMKIVAVKQAPKK